MTHSEAVRVAQSGEGAIVATLLRLDKAAELNKGLADRMERRALEALDRADDAEARVVELESRI